MNELEIITLHQLGHVHLRNNPPSFLSHLLLADCGIGVQKCCARQFCEKKHPLTPDETV